MRAHSETIAQRPRVGVSMDVGGVDWFHRLCQWFRSITQTQRQIGPVSLYRTWDAERERFRPMRAEAAADLLASQHGAVWLERIYSAHL
jgi:hypothetical protein